LRFAAWLSDSSSGRRLNKDALPRCFRIANARE
jgi:hypothetical protein